MTNYYSSCLRAFIRGLTVPSAVTAYAVLLAASASKSLMNAAATKTAAATCLTVSIVYQGVRVEAVRLWINV